MTELLAPGVYTIETSFRARSIQGVGTSTSGFAGLARSGPVGGPPQLITSFAEFERIYGGLQDLKLDGADDAPKTNFAAHAVRAFFAEQGARVYFSRAFAAKDPVNDTGHASATLVDAAPLRLALRSRFPGAGSNGSLMVSEAVKPATDRAIAVAPVGALARSRGSAETPATLRATAPPAPLKDGDQLVIGVNGAGAQTLTFQGATASVTGQQAIAFPVQLPEGTTLTVIEDGMRQVIALPTDIASAAILRNEINNRLQRSRATIPNTNIMTITSTAAGSAVSVTVEQLDALGFTQPATTGSGTGMSRLDRIGASDINTLLADAGLADVRASAVPGGSLVLETVETGATRSIDVSGTGAGVLKALGFEPTTTSATGTDGIARAYYVRSTEAADGWLRYTLNGGAGRWETDENLVDPAPTLGDDAYLVLVNFVWTNADGIEVAYEDMSVVEGHSRYIGNRMRAADPGAEEPIGDPLILDAAGLNGAEFHARLFAGGTIAATDEMRRTIALTNGNDGALPPLAAWEAALDNLNRYDDIAIVASPGSSAYPLIQRNMRAALIAHAEISGFRIAVLDPPPGQSLDALRNTRGEIDSSYAALYAPWIRVANPLARPGNESIPREIMVPPSGHVIGIYARNDQLRGVHKTPANEVIRTALGFETNYNQAQQGVLNPIGVNCLRTLAGRGNRVYGGRLATSDREVVYVSDRRYLNFIKRSIYESMQWAVFEPNGPTLWSSVREAVASFLYNQWFNHALFGNTTEEAYFVVCDGSVMTQADIDNGRLICEIGLALLKPAEFVVFRIGQKTADMRR